MTDRIEPALTPDEWTGLLRTDNEELEGCDAGEIAEDLERRRENGASWHADYKRYHKAAAVCLYGQPFGFTQEDVEWLHEAAQFTKQGWASHGAKDTDSEPALLNLAARIAALLPPRQDFPSASD